MPKTPKNTAEPRMTGALLDPLDPRDIHLGGVFRNLEGGLQRNIVGLNRYPDEKITDLSVIPVKNQGWHGACVGFARYVMLTYYAFKDTGKVLEISPSWGYGASKSYDGIPNIDGTYPRTLNWVNMEIGAMLEKDFSRPISMSREEYRTLEITDTMKVQAAMQRIKSYATYFGTEDELIEALNKHDLLEVTLVCDGYWNTLPFKNKDGVSIGFHRVVIYGYGRKNGNRVFYVRNSWGETWGEGGNGYFQWNTFAGKIFDIYTFEDIPNNHLEEVKNIPIDLQYQWNSTLRKGNRNNDVKNMQWAFKLEGCMDVLEKADGVFGPITERAAQEFQKKYKLYPDGIVGPITRKYLNENFAFKEGKPGTMLHKWALAIQAHEGYFAPGTHPRYSHGTLAWKNNNPGNIRCAGKYKAMAEACHPSNFCIFKDYETGLKALKILLTDAATKGGLYDPEGSLIDFFKVYAPASDNNTPETYALAVARDIGVPVETPIKNLIS